MVGLKSAVPLLGAVCSMVVSASLLPGAYIFEFNDDHDRSSTLDTLRKDAHLRMDLDFDLFNGASVQLKNVDNADEVVDRLAALPAMKRWWPVSLHPIPDVQVHWSGNPQGENHLEARDNSTHDEFSPHVMTQIDKLHAKGYTGKGVHVAVIDTGIDYKHPALGGCFGKGCLVTTGYNFVGDNFNGTNDATPNEDPMDCQGHGSHVAGIVAATDEKLGMTGGAPGVTLGAYRVFGCEGVTSTDTLIAAMNRAYQDNATIITVSIGGPNGWEDNAWAVASSRIVAQGVIVTMSAGNEGKQGAFWASSGASGRGVAAIASFTNTVTPTLVYYGNATIGDGTSQEFSYVLGSPGEFDTTLPLWANTSETAVVSDFCDPLPDNTTDFSNYVVLIRRGICNFDVKVANAAAKGAAYILFYNNIDDHPIFLSLGAKVPPEVRAVGFTDKKVGEAWVEQLKAGKEVVVTLGSNLDTKLTLKNIDNPISGGAVSTFTSWGPTWTLGVKPQFGAPGGMILSTYPRAKGSYAVLSGTSMACPLAASVYALLVEVRGTRDPNLLRNLLASNANPQLFNDGTRFSSGLAPVIQQGSGLIQAYDAAFATTLLEPSSLSFNETSYLAASKNFTLRNAGNREVSYEISYRSTPTTITLDKNSKSVIPFPGEFSNDYATIAFSESKVTLKKDEKVTVEVVATPPSIDGSRLPVWSGYVIINGTDGTSISLPYQGLVGSLHNHTVLAKNSAYIANGDDKDYTPVAPNTTFSVPKAGIKGWFNLPAVAFAPYLGSSRLEFHVIPIAENGTSMERLGQTKTSPVEWAPRAKDSIKWNGQLKDGTFAPEGTYTIEVKALRLYGDVANNNDWDVSVTPPFRIRYATKGPGAAFAGEG